MRVDATLWRRFVTFDGVTRAMSFVRLPDGQELGPFADREAAQAAFVDWCEREGSAK